MEEEENGRQKPEAVALCVGPNVVAVKDVRKLRSANKDSTPQDLSHEFLHTAPSMSALRPFDYICIHCSLVRDRPVGRVVQSWTSG